MGSRWTAARPGRGDRVDADSFEKLKAELAAIGDQIQLLTAAYYATNDPDERDLLFKEFRQLKWQAIFYVKKLQNSWEV